jgi:hypothetical protein
MREAINPLLALAAEDIAVLLIQHERKGGGDLSDAARGSTALAGAVDILLTIKRPEGKGSPNLRQIETISRLGDAPPRIFIELTEAGYVSRGDARLLAKEQGEGALLEVAPDSETKAMPLSKLAEAAGISRSTAQRAIHELLEQGTLQTVGHGRKNDPVRYWAPGKGSAQTTTPMGRNESGRKRPRLRKGQRARRRQD